MKLPEKVIRALSIGSLRLCRIGVAIGVCGLAACDLAPAYDAPAQPLPEHWTLARGERDSLTRWWTHYNDATLDRLIERTLAHNADLQLAAARVAESRALLGASKADQYPQLDAQGITSRLDPGDSSLPLQGTQTNYAVAPVLSFEVDLWGRLANATEAARRQMLADEANMRAVRLAVIAETASHYFAATALHEQTTLTKKTIDTRTKALKLQQQLFHEGEGDELSMRQAEAELQSAQAELPALEQQRQLRLNALSVLVGATPAELFDDTQHTLLQGARLPDVPALPDLGPEQVIGGRPDIVQAEQQIRMRNAQIGVARAAYLPKLSLTALLGFQGDSLDNVFNGFPATVASGALAGPLFDFGRVQTQVEASEARQKQAYITYGQTVRTAFGEIRNALTGYEKTKARLTVQEQQVNTLTRTSYLAQRQFDTGVVDYLTVLDAKRNLYKAESAAIDTRRARLQTSVDIYKALGGGNV